MQFEVIKNLVKEDFRAVDDLIISSLHSKASLINDLGRYIIQAGGKRLRPLVVLLSAKAIGYNGNDHIPLAAIIELIHTATLLHDDVVDNSELRRGKETANHVWGNEAAVLVGDFIYSKAFQIMVGVAQPKIMQVLADTTNTMAEGEALQLLDRHNPTSTEGAYLNIIQSKTGKLFEAAALMGAILCKSKPPIEEAMARYGMHLGTAFQLVDDILDYSANPEQSGKQLGNDLKQGKITLPLIHALEIGNPSQNRLIQQVIREGNDKRWDDILTIIEECGGIKYTNDFARSEVERAQKALSILPPTAYREGAIALADFALERTY